MKHIFVNLKRFDVPKDLGGICPIGDPVRWIEAVISESIETNLGAIAGIKMTFFPPESLIPSAIATLKKLDPDGNSSLSIGCQGVFREDVVPGGNFGAFTTNLPAKAARVMGCSWAIIGHSEERKDKQTIMQYFAEDSIGIPLFSERAIRAVNRIVNEEVLAALRSGLKVLLCVGETASERGDGSFSEQKERLEVVLSKQLEVCLKGTADFDPSSNIVIGYEPIWAIGPGKTPPTPEYIAYVSAFLKESVQRQFNFTPCVVYGGGLKRENSAAILGIETIDGGLVALTHFVGEIGFSPKELALIINEHLIQRATP